MASALWVLDGETRLPADAERRHELRAKLAAGELDELVFEACVFRAVYPNRNYLRFRDEDLEAFAASFVGQPFLRDHNAYELAARGGTVRGSWLEGVGGAPKELMQRIALTVPRDIEAFLNQTIDRFSIGWYWTPPLCSVCGTEWLGRECNHWPGRKYGVGEGGKREALCELVFVAPAGKETSAVNAPAVGGTGCRGVLAELMAVKQDLWEGEGWTEEKRDHPVEGEAQESGWAAGARGAVVTSEPDGRRRWPGRMAAGDRTEVTGCCRRGCLAVGRRSLAYSAARGRVGCEAGRVGSAGGVAGGGAGDLWRRVGRGGSWTA